MGGPPNVVAEKRALVPAKVVASGRPLNAVSRGARPTFGVGGKVTTLWQYGGEGQAVAIDHEGRVVVAGFANTGLSDDFAITRYTPTGNLDLTFGGTGIVTTSLAAGEDVAWSVVVDSQDRVLVAGYSRVPNSTGGFDYVTGVVRLTAVGALDPTFDGDGKQTISFGGTRDEQGGRVAVDSQNRVLVGGATYNGSNFDFAVARLTVGGQLDPSFDGDGKQTIDFGGSQDNVDDVAVDSQDRVVLVGSAGGSMGVARLTFAARLTRVRIQRQNNDLPWPRSRCR